ncbi:2Fe-2S iron-sulfur cluster-binding protein [Rhodococcoides fascians]|uniref:2Fe-2S iron-sulfur cluster-binding protein n=1 Tax=Rhodococcoides fascians TaxID=1828 RepID=UPI000567F18D|nr:2Fe-2S iron-sulfur cluster-binding protein [Rhodococcus fascians]
MTVNTIGVRFVSHDGKVFKGRVDVGQSLMRAAQRLNVPGIIAECGGMAACSTCHCYIDSEWLDKLVPIDDMEEGMLEIAIEPDERSRLSCQIKLRPELDGLSVTVPREQA